MIRHVVFFSARHGNDIETIRKRLGALGSIPSAENFEVALNSKVDQISNEIDVVVYAEFADQAALDAYKKHPIYAETTSVVRPMRELRFSADFVTGPDAGNPSGRIGNGVTKGEKARAVATGEPARPHP